MKKYDSVLVIFDISSEDIPVASTFTRNKKTLKCMKHFTGEEAIELYNKLTDDKEEEQE